MIYKGIEINISSEDGKKEIGNLKLDDGVSVWCKMDGEELGKICKLKDLGYCIRAAIQTINFRLNESPKTRKQKIPS